MTIKGVLFRFLLLYSVLLLATSFALQCVEVKANSGVGFGLLLGSIFCVCYAFGKKNHRYFTQREKIMVVSGSVLISLSLQGLATYAAIPGNKSSVLLSKYFLFGFVLIAVLHIVASYWAVGFTKNILARQGSIRE